MCRQLDWGLLLLDKEMNVYAFLLYVFQWLHRFLYEKFEILIF